MVEIAAGTRLHLDRRYGNPYELRDPAPPFIARTREVHGVNLFASPLRDVRILVEQVVLVNKLIASQRSAAFLTEVRRQAQASLMRFPVSKTPLLWKKLMQTSESLPRGF